MKKIDDDGNCTFEYLNYMNSLDKKDLLNFAIGADLLADILQQRIDKAMELLKKYNDEENNYYVPVDNCIDILKGSDKE